MNSTNLTLWQSVEKTPVEQTKPITGKSYSGNSPKPHHIVRRATETFGPCGIGWGFKIVEERIVDTATYADGTPERMHYAKVQVWYMWGGQRGEVEHVGGTILSGRRKQGDGPPFTDDDAPKKSITDALIKALSMIGFAGDIFLGRYDDSKYMAELREEAKAEKQAASAPQSPPASRQPPKAPRPAQSTVQANAHAHGAPTRPPLDEQGGDPIPFGDDGGEVRYVNSKGQATPLNLADAVSRLEKAAEATTSLSDEEFAGLLNANADWLLGRANATMKALFRVRNMDPADWLR